MNIIINKDITDTLPQFNIVAFTMNISLYENDDLLQAINDYEVLIRDKYALSDIVNIDGIKEARDGYKKLKKDPSHCKVAVESLFRRIIKGNKLYNINNIVDAGNLLSLCLKKSVAVLDLDKINGDVKIRLGRSNDYYEGIGRGQINVENIPVYEDNISPFGCPTSDTIRTSITNETKKILVMVICFQTFDEDEITNIVCDVYKKYGCATNITKIDVKKV